jgi:hypothetical protein
MTDKNVHVGLTDLCETAVLSSLFSEDSAVVDEVNKMTEQEVIELGNDGTFDISAEPFPKAFKARHVGDFKPDVTPDKTSKGPTCSGSQGLVSPSATLADWELKKERGNRAFSEGLLELAVTCYTDALDSLAVIRIRIFFSFICYVSIINIFPRLTLRALRLFPRLSLPPSKGPHERYWNACRGRPPPACKSHPAGEPRPLPFEARRGFGDRPRLRRRRRLCRVCKRPR